MSHFMPPRIFSIHFLGDKNFAHQNIEVTRTTVPIRGRRSEDTEIKIR